MNDDGHDGHNSSQTSFQDPYSRSRYDQGIDSKIVIMGNSGVGKTSLLQRYTQNRFDPKNTTSTSGAFFVTKKVYINGVKVRLQLWDTAGQERFRSMAPMYYRGANAALLLYDITNLASFQDVKGWLEELKKNCNPDLLIYIVGAKADLSGQRQVTSDIARLSLHNWFPPPRKPTPPPPPPLTSLGSYIRPRFTSFPGLKSPPLTPSGAPSSSPPNHRGHGESGPTSPENPAYLDLPSSTSSPASTSSAIRAAPPLQRSRTHHAHAPPPVRPRTANSLTRCNTTSTAATSRTPQSSRFGFTGGYDNYENSSNSIEEEDESGEDEREWGLSKGMELFEVSAKDDSGIQTLFDHLISAIIQRKDAIEQENELRKRDSVFLSSVSQPAWSAQADAEEAREKARSKSGSWSCC